MKKYVFCFLIFVSSIFSLYAAQPNTETFERALVDQKRSVEQTFLTYPEWFLVLYKNPNQYQELRQSSGQKKRFLIYLKMYTYL